MQQIKLFVDIESNIESMEERINRWLTESNARIVNVFGNIAPQTVTPEAKSSALGERKFSSSDVFVAIVYEQS